MNSYVIRGGSGIWNLICDGKIIASGHIPHNAPVTVIGDQLSYISTAETDSKKRLGGGSMLSLEKCGISETEVKRILALHEQKPKGSALSAFARYHQD